MLGMIIVNILILARLTQNRWNSRVSLKLMFLGIRSLSLYQTLWKPPNQAGKKLTLDEIQRRLEEDKKNQHRDESTALFKLEKDFYMAPKVTYGETVVWAEDLLSH